MPSIVHYETEHAQAIWNPLISFNAQVMPWCFAQACPGSLNYLILLVPRLCPGMPPCPPYNPHTGGARLRAVRTRNEEGSDRASMRGSLPFRYTCRRPPWGGGSKSWGQSRLSTDPQSFFAKSVQFSHFFGGSFRGKARS